MVQNENITKKTAMERLATGAVWTLLGTIVAQAAALIASILASRFLGPNGFGELGMTRSTLVLFSVPAGTGLGVVATKYVAECRHENPARAGRLIGLLLNLALALSAVMAVVCFASGGMLSANGMKAGQLAAPLRIGSLLLVITTLNSVMLGAINGFESFREAARLSLYDALLNLAFIPAGAWCFGVSGAMAGAAVAAAAGMIFKHRALERACQAAGMVVTHRNVGAEFGVIWSFAVPAIIAGITTQPFEWLGRLWLARQGGFVELGLFTAAQSCGQIVTFLPGQFTAPAMPIMANLHAGKKAGVLAQLLKLNLLFTVGLGLAVALPLAVLGPWLMQIYGFATGGNVIRVLVMASVLAALSSFFRAILMATGRMWWQTMHTLVWSCTFIGVWWRLSDHGALGLAASYLAAFAAIVVTQGVTAWLALRGGAANQPANSRTQGRQ